MKISKDGEGRKSEMRELAIRYQRLGFNVVPTTKEKHPIGSWKAAQEERQEETAVAGMTWDAGVAAVCGPVSGDLLAIDIDKAENDAVCYAALQAMGLPRDYPWTVQTPGQGFHIWVRCPAAELEQHLDGKGKLIGDLPGCKQVELRWTGCIAVLPPSLHPNGNRYAFWNGDGIPDEPPTMRGAQAVLAAASWRGGKSTNAVTEPDADVDPPAEDADAESRSENYLQAALAGETEKVATAYEGTRNDTLNAAAFALGQLHTEGLTKEQVYDALRDAATRAGLAQREIGSTFESGWEDGKAKPRSAVEQLSSYPIDALPTDVRDFVSMGAASIGCDPVMVAAPLLAYLGGMIGNGQCLELKQGWKEYPVLWMAVVAPPGSAKTPADGLARRGLEYLQGEAKDTYEEEYKIYEIQKEEYEKEKKKKKGGGDDMITRMEGEIFDDRPVKPHLDHYYTTDVTIEALADILNHSIGLTLARDELVGWVCSHDAYKGGKGGERQQHLSNWSSANLKVDRKTKEPIIVRDPVVCVTGGIQPDLLAELAQEVGRRDGFLERFLFAHPPVHPIKWSEASVPPGLAMIIRGDFEQLREPEEQDPITLSEEAKAVWVQWHDENSDLIPDVTGTTAGMYAKMPSQCARLALILHCLDNPGFAHEVPVTEETMQSAIAIAEYHRAHNEYVLRKIETTQAGSGDGHLRERLLAAFAEQGELTRTGVDKCLGGG